MKNLALASLTSGKKKRITVKHQCTLLFLTMFANNAVNQ